MEPRRLQHLDTCLRRTRPRASPVGGSRRPPSPRFRGLTVACSARPRPPVSSGLVAHRDITRSTRFQISVCARHPQRKRQRGGVTPLLGVKASCPKKHASSTTHGASVRGVGGAPRTAGAGPGGRSVVPGAPPLSSPATLRDMSSQAADAPASTVTARSAHLTGGKPAWSVNVSICKLAHPAVAPRWRRARAVGSAGLQPRGCRATGSRPGPAAPREIAEFCSASYTIRPRRWSVNSTTSAPGVRGVWTAEAKAAPAGQGDS